MLCKDWPAAISVVLILEQNRRKMEGGRGIKIQEEAESFALGVSSRDKDVQIPLYAFMC